MMKKIFLGLLFVFQLTNAQYTVEGVFTNASPKISSVALFSIVKNETQYIKYVNVIQNKFTFSMKDLPSGHYRALYKNTNTGYVDFIYHQENIKFNFDSTKGDASVAFTKSSENQLLGSYNYSLNQLQYKLDALQVNYFKNPKTDTSNYQSLRQKIEATQQYYEDLAKNHFCLSAIKASKRYNAPLPFRLPNDYVQNITRHFFDYLDFTDNTLRNSMFFKTRIKEYILYLHQANKASQQNGLYIKAVQKVLNQIHTADFKEEVLRFLIDEFLIRENSQLVTELVKTYKALPAHAQRKRFLAATITKSKTLIGALAPNIQISKTERLYSLNTAQQYLVVFWSSTCSHCAMELPKVAKLLATQKNMTVVSVGLEKSTDKAMWRKTAAQFKNWINVFSAGKWDSKDAIAYDVNATPSYFLLNADKKIIAKPKNYKALQKIIGKN